MRRRWGFPRLGDQYLCHVIRLREIIVARVVCVRDASLVIKMLKYLFVHIMRKCACALHEGLVPLLMSALYIV
jgi:hypothetical protein